MLARQCSLGALASKEPAGELVFFIKDNSPFKPDRWLALPRQQIVGFERLADLPAETRTALWTQAIAKAKSLWGDRWGLAYNGDHARSQCQAHIHIGKLIEGVESGKFVVVSSPAEIPVPDPNGAWIHAVQGKLHVHLGEQLNENVLLR